MWNSKYKIVPNCYLRLNIDSKFIISHGKDQNRCFFNFISKLCLYGKFYQILDTATAKIIFFSDIFVFPGEKRLIE